MSAGRALLGAGLAAMTTAGCSCGGARGGGSSASPQGLISSSTAGTTRAASPSVAAWSRLERRLDDARRGGRDTVVFRAPARGEAEAYGAWVSAVVAAAKSGSKAPPAAPVGFTLEPLDEGALWLLAERPDGRRGAGAVLIRVGAAKELVVEAPHTFFDAKTLPIAVAAFDVQRARALVVNTAHRYRERIAAGDDPHGGGDEPTGQPVASDVAHADASFFLAAHENLVAAGPRTPTLQLHGFGDGAAPSVLAIVSPARTTADARALAESLRGVFGDRGVRVYPEEIGVLGGTTNVQAARSAAAGAPFFHVELSRSARDRLASDEAHLAAFAAALSACVGGRP